MKWNLFEWIDQRRKRIAVLSEEIRELKTEVKRLKRECEEYKGARDNVFIQMTTLLESQKKTKEHLPTNPINEHS